MADVVEINDIEQLEQYRLAWNALLPRTPKASFFHSFDWLKLYWKHFGESQTLRVLVVRSQDTVIGIVPFCIKRESYSVGTVRVLTYPLSDWGMWYGPIGPNQAATLHMAMKHLSKTPRDWDMVDLRWTAVPKEKHCTSAKALEAVDWQPQLSAYQHGALIRIAGSDYEQYLASRSKKWRHESRRQVRVLARHGEVTFERHRPDAASQGDGNPRWDLYEDCLRISQKSWQGKSTTGNTLCHEHVRDFLQDSHAMAAKHGMLDLAILKLDGVPIAFQYNYHYQGEIFGLRMGYDRDYTKQGAGKVLLTWMIEDSFQRNDVSINLGGGDYQYKHRYQTHVETSYRVMCFPHLAWRPQGVRLTRWFKQQLAKPKQPEKATPA
ncbi:MAG: GNAT family N-acetyltransferase [Planctomycetes bacterium]|nr:GNAT family N-acetyltransferase [Planctomycetota bacterium]